MKENMFYPSSTGAQEIQTPSKVYIIKVCQFPMLVDQNSASHHMSSILKYKKPMPI